MDAMHGAPTAIVVPAKAGDPYAVSLMIWVAIETFDGWSC